MQAILPGLSRCTDTGTLLTSLGGEHTGGMESSLTGFTIISNFHRSNADKHETQCPKVSRTSLRQLETKLYFTPLSWTLISKWTLTWRSCIRTYIISSWSPPSSRLLTSYSNLNWLLRPDAQLYSTGQLGYPVHLPGNPLCFRDPQSSTPTYIPREMRTCPHRNLYVYSSLIHNSPKEETT